VAAQQANEGAVTKASEATCSCTYCVGMHIYLLLNRLFHTCILKAQTSSNHIHASINSFNEIIFLYYQDTHVHVLFPIATICQQYTTMKHYVRYYRTVTGFTCD